MTPLGRREKCQRNRSEKGVFSGVACPSEGKPPSPGAAGNMWTNTG